MTGLTILQEAARTALPFVPMLVEAALRVTVLLVVAFGLLRILKDTSPSRRHLLWLSAIGGSLFVFALTLTGPVFRVAFRHGAPDAPGTLSALSSALLPTTGTFGISGGMPPLAAQAWRTLSMGQQWLSLWPSVAVLIWIGGVLSGWLRILWGRLQLLNLAREGPRAAAAGARMVGTLAARVGIPRRVRVVVSERCVTPLTRGVVHPMIYLPSSMQGWPAAARRSVLLHELRHIRRGDSCTLAIAYGVCSLLWFIPPIWAAYSRLYLEQEKACDAAVVESGVKPHAYASCVLNAAQLCREPALLAGLSLSGRRKKILKDRIGAIIRQGKPAKRSIALFGLATVLLVLALLLGAAGRDTGRRYGLLYLTEYNVRSAEEAGILNTLIQFEGAYNTHDQPRLLSLFARGAVYMPYGCWYSKFPVESPYCRHIIAHNFKAFRFQTYYDPRITVRGDTAVVALLLESVSDLADYTFIMKKTTQGWLVSEVSYSNCRPKG